MFDELQEIYFHLSTNKLRTFLTGLSVSMGIFLLIVLLGAGNGLINAFKFNDSNTEKDMVDIYPGLTSAAYKGLNAGRNIEFTNNDPFFLQQALPHQINYAIGTLTINNLNFKHYGKQIMGNLVGVMPEDKNLDNLHILYGRYIDQHDITERRKNIVLGYHTAKDFFSTADKAIHQTINIDGLSYHIIGVKDDRGRFKGTEAYIPISTLQLIYKKGNEIDKISLNTKNVAQTDQSNRFETIIRFFLSALHGFNPDDIETIYYYNRIIGAANTEKAFKYIENSLWILGLLTLLSGVAGISNIMFITVKERTREIGIRKALGAKNHTILRSILLESTIITSFFGLIGLLVGLATTFTMANIAGTKYIILMGQTYYTFLNPTVGFDVAVQALVVLIVAGLIAGLIPSLKAIKMKPIDALRAG